MTCFENSVCFYFQTVADLPELKKVYLQHRTEMDVFQCIEECVFADSTLHCAS